MSEMFILNISGTSLDESTLHYHEENPVWFEKYSREISRLFNQVSIQKVSYDNKTAIYKFKITLPELSIYCNEVYNSGLLKKLIKTLIVYNRRNYIALSMGLRKNSVRCKEYQVYEVIHHSKTGKFFDVSADNKGLVPGLISVLLHPHCLGISTFFDQTYNFKSTQFFFTDEIVIADFLNEQNAGNADVLQKRVAFNQLNSISTFQEIRRQPTLDHNLQFLESVSNSDIRVNNKTLYFSDENQNA